MFFSLTVWMYIALVGGVVFILIQVWLLIFFSRSFGNKITHKIAEGGNRCCWFGGKDEIIQAVSNRCTHFQKLISQFLPPAQCSVTQLQLLELWCYSTYSRHGMVVLPTKYLSELMLFCAFCYQLYLH